MRWLLISASVATLALHTGCAHRVNKRTVLGGGTELEAIAAEPAPQIAYVPADRLDRGGWDAQTFLVPVDGTVHTPHWRTLRQDNTTDKPRRKGLFPTAESALDLETDAAVLWREAGVAFPLTLLDMGFIPLNAARNPPWARRQSPQWLHKRFDQDRWYAGPMPGEDADASPG